MNTEGFTVNVLGDSITEGHGLTDLTCRYDRLLKEMCGWKEVRNYGIGGTRIAHQTHPSACAWWDLDFCGRVYRMDPQADLVIVYGGTNDYGHGDAPFGKVGDTDRTTFCGSVRYLLEALTTRYPDAVRIIMTPARRTGDLLPSQNADKTVPGFPLKNYADAIRAVAANYPVRVLDLYEDLGIDPNKEDDRIRYTADGLHFNEAGHRAIAEKLRAFIEAL